MIVQILKSSDLKFMTLWILFLIMIQNLQAGNIEKLDRYKIFQDKQDSIIWVENPIPDQNMGIAEEKTIDITLVFSTLPDTTAISVNVPVISNTSLLTATLDYNEAIGQLNLKLKTKSAYGHAFVTITAECDFGSATDVFMVTVDNPDYEWIEGGTSYSFEPQNCLGSGTMNWKAAQEFYLGADEYEVKQIEFGFALSENVTWEIVKFDQQPTDSVIGNLSGTKTVQGGRPAFIESGFTGIVTDSVAVVFSSTGNFMAMDPVADSEETWIYVEAYGWIHPADITSDYEGAWYLRIQLRNISTGIIEEFTSGIPDDCSLRNYPNPFNNQSVISWEIDKPSLVELDIYNSKGEFVKNLVRQRQNNTKGSSVFNSDGLNSGVYYYQLRLDGKIISTKKMLYLK